MSKHWTPPADEGQGRHKKITIGNQECYLLASEYPNGDLARIEIVASKQGSCVRGFLDDVSTLITLGLQNGLTTEQIATALSGNRYEPAGWTSDKEIRNATSIPDYVAQWMMLKYPSKKATESETITDSKSGRSEATDAKPPMEIAALPEFTLASSKVKDGTLYDKIEP
jgi:hypothetical protein